MRKEFASYCKENLLADGRYQVFLGDISVGLFASEIGLIENVHNIGILEQSMISFAAGVACSGMVPIVHTISPFLIERAYEQIKLDLSYNQNKVILVSANGPYDYNKLGPTHHCPSDIPLVEMLSGVEWFAPGRTADVSACMSEACKLEVSSYVRLTSSYANTDIPCAEIIKSDCSSEKLHIFVGEALLNYNARCESDQLYIYRKSQLDEIDLSSYSSFVVWEPYSVPIIGLVILRRYPNTKVTINTYPRSIETGVYDRPVYVQI